MCPLLCAAERAYGGARAATSEARKGGAPGLAARWSAAHGCSGNPGAGLAQPGWPRQQPLSTPVPAAPAAAAAPSAAAEQQTAAENVLLLRTSGVPPLSLATSVAGLHRRLSAGDGAGGSLQFRAGRSSSAGQSSNAERSSSGSGGGGAGGWSGEEIGSDVETAAEEGEEGTSGTSGSSASEASQPAADSGQRVASSHEAAAAAALEAAAQHPHQRDGLNTCSHCGTTHAGPHRWHRYPAAGGVLCNTCEMYFYRTGSLRPQELIWRASNPPEHRTCAVCERSGCKKWMYDAQRRDLCFRCWQWAKRHGGVRWPHHTPASGAAS